MTRAASSEMQQPLELTVAARMNELAPVRRSLRRWLRQSGATEADISAIVLASNEACANAIEHAYGSPDATFELRAEHAVDSVRITIRDSGCWRSPRGTGRGRGIELMRAFMDAVDIGGDDSGTIVRMSKTWTRRHEGAEA